MAGIRWLSILTLAWTAWSTSNKEVVAQIQCAVCKIAVKEAKEKGREDEDALVDAVENVCSASKDEGKWIAKIDIFQRDGEDELSLDRRVEEGTCRDECKSVQRACALSLKGMEEKLVSLIMDGAGAGKLQREVCKKACKKVRPKVGQWTDEKFDEISKTKMPDPPTPPPAAPKEELDIVKDFNPLMPDVVAAALVEFGTKATAAEINKCFTGENVGEDIRKEITQVFLEETKAATEEMMEKRLETMRSGLRRLGGVVAKLAGNLQEWCSEEVAADAKRMKALGDKLVEFCNSDEASVIEYEVKESLKVAGRDMHLPLNTLLGALKKGPADGQAFGQALAKLFKVLEVDSESAAAKTEL